MKKKRKSKQGVPDDIVLVVAGFIVGLFYLWGGLNGVKSDLDWYLLIGPCMVMILVPMVYSSIVYRRNKKG